MLFTQILGKYHRYMARRHFRLGQSAQCLHHLNILFSLDQSLAKEPKLSAYLALCHFRLQYWDNISYEVECALFLLRRFIQEDKESFVLWQELKSHLALLQNAERSCDSVTSASAF